MTSDNIVALYENRFLMDDQLTRIAMWEVAARQIFQPYVRATDCVVDIGAGRCELINALRAQERFAVDPSGETLNFHDNTVKVISSSAPHGLRHFDAQSVDIVTCCNLFEHVEHREWALDILRAIRRVLKTDGRLIILMPNIRYAYKVYWDYLDHIIPWSHESLTEALELTGFRVEFLRKRYLPYSTRHVPKWPWALRLYLLCPPAWWLWGKQMFVVARPV